MNGSFNGQILVDKLAKLNNSQQSIETLSHWCIFHRNKARQVVETWERQFHSAPRERRVSFLYLANDILQNSRRKGVEFITEFWRVLPDALKDVLKNGDEFGKNAVIRLVDIWEDRKVFGSRGQMLKEELFGRNAEQKNNRDAKGISYKLRQPGGEMLEKLVSSYEHVYNAPVNDDSVLDKCQVAVSFVDKIDKEFGNNSYLGSNNGSEVMGELQVQHCILRDSIEQLKASESLRSTLISHLREALHEQEVKMEQVRSQLQVAQSRYEHADILCQKLGIYVARQPVSNQGLNESTCSETPATFIPDSSSCSLEKGQSSAVMYSQEGEGGERKTTAANVVAKLAACTASHEILSGVFSSLATGGVIDEKINEQHSPGNKRQKLENEVYVPQPQLQPPPPPFPHPDTFQQPPPPPQQSPSPQSSPPPPPPLPTSMPPPIPPPPPPTTSPFMPVPGFPMTGMPYGTFPSPFTPLPNFPMVNMPPPFPGAPNPYQGIQGSEGAFFGPPFSAAPPPMNRQ